MKKLYPEIQPFHTFYLQTGSIHSVYVERCGNPEGLPVLFLHGGPCSGIRPEHRQFFDPEIYHVILFDQRGSGLSQPYGELEHNTTHDLLDDMERIREQLKISQWVLFGGSWGGTLALLYAQQYTLRVSALIIRGVFLARQEDLEWFTFSGARRIYPERWQCLINCITDKSARKNLVQGLYDVLFGEDEVARMRVAKEWALWGGQVSLGNEFQYTSDQENITQKILKQARMELQYAKNHYYMSANQILNNADLIQNIPTYIIHGRNDLVCPVEAGWSLSQALPRAEFIVLPFSGHVARGEAMIDALVDASDKLAISLT